MVRQGRVEERLGETSDARFVGFRPELIGLDERVQDREQLSHGRGQGDFLGFPFTQQTLVKGFDSGIESCGHERGQVQNATDIRSAAKRVALAQWHSLWRFQSERPCFRMSFAHFDKDVLSMPECHGDTDVAREPAEYLDRATFAWRIVVNVEP